MNKKVKGFAIQNLQNQEHFGFVTELNIELTRSALETLKPLSARFTPLIKEEDDALEMIAKSEYTKQLVELDAACDTIYRGLVRTIHAEKCSPVKDDAQAAELLQIVVDAYGNFIGGSYENQHNKTLNFLQDLRSEKYKSAADRIRITRWIDWLEEADNNFMALFRTRRDEQAQAAINYRPLRFVRKDLDALYRETVTHINALAVLQPSEALDTLIARVNVHIDRLSANMASRSTRAKEKTGE